ncbi:MAG: 16S rRNA (adenine(1518)-N(6)/adenine(1519)-N(6))-dimethyltransferase RsmA [Oscillospiraceae bacterium]|nr:16S rRNA (adenine(1518)-N(6)/adenine(1519)-N(6))-dimethyltransferase RsmA [Oscillospiraceae bacterium]
MDEKIIDKIIDSVDIKKEDVIIEIGAGLATLTKHLCKKAKKVIAIELDKDFIEILNLELKEYKNIEIIQGDILKINLRGLADGEKIKIVGNLPYYITSEIIYKILKEDMDLVSLTIMVQKEVCDKIFKTKVPLSVILQFYFLIHIVDTISPNSFFPNPKVTSSVLNLEPKSLNDDIDKNDFINFVTNSFKMRRKTLINNLKIYFDESKIIRILNNLNINLKIRAEELDVIDFYNLFIALL